jgi:hypothetical protein
MDVQRKLNIELNDMSVLTGTIVDNKLIWFRYIRRASVIGENHQKITGSILVTN